MELRKILEKLQKSAIFKEWKEKNKACFLAHVFVMLDEANKDVWQMAYYCKAEDRLTTFLIEKEDIKLIPGQEIFKSKDEIKELQVDDVKVSVNEAFETAEKCKKENYPKEINFKSFFIIQNSNLGQIYNITYLTGSFKAINIKISAKDGKILNNSIYSLVEQA